MQSLLLITNLRRFTPYFHNTCTEISAMALRKDKQDLVAEFLHIYIYNGCGSARSYCLPSHGVLQCGIRRSKLMGSTTVTQYIL